MCIATPDVVNVLVVAVSLVIVPDAVKYVKNTDPDVIHSYIGSQRVPRAVEADDWCVCHVCKIY